MSFIEIMGTPLEYKWINQQKNESSTTIVMLHEGLGGISTWDDFPRSVASASGLPLLLYSRHGYGNSHFREPSYIIRYMHDEALLVLPELLEKLGIDHPILLGHSDGGSIALIYASSIDINVSGLILLAPHVMVEDLTIRSISDLNIQYQTTKLPRHLARHHADADRTFNTWKNVWLHSDFRSWNIEEYLCGIDCPILAIQGENDEYGTMNQIALIDRQVLNVRQVRLPDCEHWPYRDRTEDVLGTIQKFFARLSR